MTKKFFNLALLLFMSQLVVGQVLEAPASETEYANSCVIRKGNTYIVGDQQMHSSAYRGYLKNTNPEAFRQFNRGYKIAMAGWGLFAVGPTLVGVSTPFWLISSFGYDPHRTPAYERHRMAVFSSNLALTCLGGASLVSGIVCLSVGYGQMHHTVRNRNDIPATYLTIENRGSEIGLALHF